MKIQSINPVTEEVMKEFDCSKPEDVTAGLRRLKENRSWAEMSVNDRISSMKNISKILERDKEQCAKLISLEMGKPIKQAISEMEGCIAMCNYFTENGESFLQDEHVDTEYQKSYMTLEPLGVILGIMPWNFPFSQVVRFAMPALLVGDRIAIKHASNVPQCAAKIEEIFNEALPENVYLNIFAKGDDASRIIESQYVDAVSLTGSTEAGSKVAEIAGKNIKKSVLELGGSDPFIILKDADLDKCCAAASMARFRNAGQV